LSLAIIISKNIVKHIEEALKVIQMEENSQGKLMIGYADYGV
jgi:hypothetical protein